MSKVRAIIEWLRTILGAIELPRPAPERLRNRIAAIERDTILPIKFILTLFLAYQLSKTQWFNEPFTMLDVAIEFILSFFWVYVVINILLAIPLIAARYLPAIILQYVVFVICLVDALFVAAMALMTGGYDSTLFWVLVGLTIRNTASLPPVVPQAVANGAVIALYTIMGWLDIEITSATAEMYDEITQQALGLVLPQTLAETLLLRVVVLSLAATCGFLIQVLAEKQRLMMEEARELAAREVEIKTASTMASKIAHRIKNPLAAINNAAFLLEKKLGNDTTLTKYVQLIKEEVSRADRVVTELIGYAKLADGKVKKLNVGEQIQAAINRVFNPPEAYPIRIKVEIQPDLPHIMLLEEHLSDILINLLSNARDVSPPNSTITVSARLVADQKLELRIQDQGPGIPPEKRELIFEPYYTTKPHGSGLGLAIVKSTVELYGGEVIVESPPEGGAAFKVLLPLRVFNEDHLRPSWSKKPLA